MNEHHAADARQSPEIDGRSDARTLGEYHWMDLAEEAGQLREAMASRAPIEQAKGMLMLIRACSEESAWTELRRASSEANVKVKDLALALVAVGGAPSQQLAESVSPLAVEIVERRWLSALRSVRQTLAELSPR